MSRKFLLSPKVFTLWLFAIASTLFTVFVVAVFSIDGYSATSGGVMGLFNLNQETSIPTWFSQSLLLMTTVFLIAVSRKVKEYRKHWSTLGVIFLYLSIDEGASMHELTVAPLRQLLNVEAGIFYYSWVLLFGFLAIVIGLFYVRFLLHLPRKTRLIFIIAAILFLAGGIGMEMVGGSLAAKAGESGVMYSLVVAIEEYLEMSGVILFLYGLLGYAKHQMRTLALVLA